MKSNRLHTDPERVKDPDVLLNQIKKEKEALVTMFLLNASISELADQYKRIDELHARINENNLGRS
jgi:hypothetical protein